MKRDGVMLVRRVSRANETEKRRERLERCPGDFEILKLDVWLYSCLRILSIEKQAALGGPTESIGKRISGWRNASIKHTFGMRRHATANPRVRLLARVSRRGAHCVRGMEGVVLRVGRRRGASPQPPGLCDAHAPAPRESAPEPGGARFPGGRRGRSSGGAR